MPTLDPRVDAYIAKAAPFAQPILTHLRGAVHEARPDVSETIKWGMPFFTMGPAILCHMAAFRQHCAFGVWKAAEIPGLDALAAGAAEGTAGMGSLGKLRDVNDLPPRAALVGDLRRAAEFRTREQGAKGSTPAKTTKTAKVATGSTRQTAAGAKRAAKPPVELPDVVRRALETDERARAAFEAFPPSHRREYVEWITEAKTEATRERRLAQMLEWLAEGKHRNWKYDRR